MGGGYAHFRVIWRTMDIDVSAHGVYRVAAVLAGFEAAQPQDARQYPVLLGMPLRQRLLVYLARGATSPEDRIDRVARADLGAHPMPAARRAFAAESFPRTIGRSRYGKLGKEGLAVYQGKILPGKRDSDKGFMDSGYHLGCSVLSRSAAIQNGMGRFFSTKTELGQSRGQGFRACTERTEQPWDYHDALLP